MVVMVGFVPEQASAFERKMIDRQNLSVLNWDRVAKNPDSEAAAILGDWASGLDRFAIHFDVDVLNFAEAPIADTSASRNVGLRLEQAQRLLSTLVSDSRCASLTISEINPEEREGESGFSKGIGHLNHVLAAALGSTKQDRRAR